MEKENNPFNTCSSEQPGCFQAIFIYFHTKTFSVSKNRQFFALSDAESIITHTYKAAS